MIFVDIKNDVAFRKIFGDYQQTDVLISFLNAVLDTKGDKIITRVSILNPFQLSVYSAGKTTIIDVKACDQAGREYIVEMQVAEVTGLSKRMLYYTSRSYTNQIDSGEKYPELSPVILIGIFNFTFTKSKNCLSHHKVMDTKTREQVVEDIEFHFIELPKFTKEVHELKSLVDKWIYFIKNAKDLTVEPKHIDDDGLKIAYNLAKRYNWSKAELEAYDYSEMREQDERGREEVAHEKGKYEKAEEVALKLLQKGMDMEFVVETTNLSLLKVKDLQSKLNGK